MSLELIDTVASLARLLAEENALFEAGVPVPAQRELVEAKTRLVGRLEADMVRFGPAWIDNVPPAVRDELLVLLDEVLAASARNGELLTRRIELCDDLLGAITAEARRLSGGRSRTYGTHGRLARSDRAVPIAINTSL